MRSLNHALCLSLCIALLFSSTHASAQRDNTPVAVNISVGDSSPYTSIIAQFGDQFYGHTFEANLMLPPDDQMLCEFSPSLVNLTTAEAHNWTASRPIALLVSRGNCSFEQKARVALQLQEKFTTLLKYMIVYNNNTTKSVTEDVLIMSTSGNDSESEELDKMGYLFVSTSSGEAILSKVEAHATLTDQSFTFLSEQNRDWDLPISMEVVALRNNGGSSSRSDSSQKSAGYSTFYWLRFLLFSLLIFSPCVRAAYLWYTSGGRILMRRNERGYINGFQYVRPVPYWFATGTEAHSNEQHAATVMTDDQVYALPELLYKAAKDDEDDDKEGDEADTTKTKESTDSELESVDIESVDIEQPLDSALLLSTTCTMCSICIDEFEDSETIRVLPKCRHGFHTECIKPWLTERQSCCPLCKTNVLPTNESDQENADAASQEHSPV